MRRRLISLLVTTCLTASVVPSVFAQFTPYPGANPQPPQAQQSPQQYPQPAGPQSAPPSAPQSGGAIENLNDPEDRQHGVARVSIAQGDVNVKRGDTGQLDAVVMNAPLMVHDHLQTAPGSRAEVTLDAVNFVRLAPNSDVGFADLQYHRFQAQVGIGTMLLRVIGNSISQVEVDTPSVALRPQGPGEYRISVLDNGTSQVTVRSGRLEMSGPSGSQIVEAGQSLLVRGDFANPEYQAGPEIGRDQFDDWSASRDNELLASQSYHYVSSDITGAQDLDANGTWVPSQYGQVWEPQGVAPDWAPYSDGQWSYTGYYGWTWIDNARWGWAPYHYGRWFMNGSRWCWWPGARNSFYLWSPALVGFFGFGHGGLGWAPLAPFELGFSWWGRGYARSGFGVGFGFNRGAGFYRNAGFRGGAITAGFGAFGGPGQRFHAATREQLAGASVFRGRLPVAPGQGAYRFSNRAAVVNPRISAGANRQFFNRSAVGAGGGFRGGNSAAGFRSAPSVGGAGGSNGWQRFGSPGSSSFTRSGSGGSAAERSGWHSFGQPQLGSQGSRGSIPNSNYQRQGFVGGQSAAPQYSAPSGQSHYSGGAPAQRYSAPAQQHYSAPQSRGGGGGSVSRGGGGGGGSRGGGGGGGSHGGGGHR
jgi:FecR protein